LNEHLSVNEIQRQELMTYRRDLTQE
jgi:hypothetical protein